MLKLLDKLPMLIVSAFSPTLSVPINPALETKLKIPSVMAVLTSAVLDPPPPSISISFSNLKSPVILALPSTTRFLSSSEFVMLIPTLPPPEVAILNVDSKLGVSLSPPTKKALSRTNGARSPGFASSL